MRITNNWLLSLFCGLVAGVTLATVGELDRGGVSVDFRKFQRIDNDSPTQSLTVAVLPFSFIDETYCLASGQVGILHVDGNNTLGRPLKDPRLVLTLPEGVRIVSLHNARLLKQPRIVERAGRKFSEYEFPGGARGYSGAHGHFILLGTDLAAGDALYPAECYLADETFQGPIRKFNIQIIAPVRGKQPKLFETGVHIWNEFSYGDPEALKTLAEQYAGTGFNSIQLGAASSSAMSAAFKTAGLRRYVQTLIVNGYGSYAGKNLPEADKYRGVDLEQVGGAVCPVAITGKGQYFSETLGPALRKIIIEDDLADGLMCNWEPFMFVNNGCFCDKCKAEFIKYAKLPPEEVEAVWPRQVTRKYAAVWPRFRSWQHARLVLTLEDTIANLGREVGKQAHFIPEIGNSFRRGE